MKTEIPPWVAAAIVIVVVLIMVAYLYFGTGPGRQAKDMEAAINATIAKPGSKAAGPLLDPGSPGAPGAAAGGPSAPQPK
ncbi:MAG TPA: hypothetical protein VFB38_20320 [Chthonomonadaceae bacterium]|nr:hypothetical protein [Chthonomonadaceae bacterium]